MLGTKKGKGFVSVLYDNFIMIGEDESTIREVYARLLRNLRKFWIIVKEGTEHFFTNDDMRVTPIAKRERDAAPMTRTLTELIDEQITSTATLPIHVGIQIGLIQRGRLNLAWRVAPKRVLQWYQTTPAWDGKPWTARQLAQTVGRIIWSHSLSLTPLYHIESILEIAKMLGKFVGSNYKRWNDTLEPSLPPNLALELERQWLDMMTNAWRQAPYVDAHAQQVYLFTDASDSGWGYVLTTADGIILDWNAFEWNQGAKQWHIFIKEVAAAVWSLQICSQKNSNLVFTVFMDNVAAEHAVGRGFSSNSLATSLMKGANLDKCRYYTRRIDTKWNPSDGPSRGFAVDADFTARVCADLDRLVLEGRAGPPPRSKYGFRHLEPECDFDDMEFVVHIKWVESDPTEVAPIHYSREKIGAPISWGSTNNE